MMVPAYDVAGPLLWYKEEILTAWDEVLHRGVLVLGPETERLERVYAGYCGKRFGIAVSSDTAAWQIALLAMMKDRQDVILIPDTAFFGIAFSCVFGQRAFRPVPVSISNAAMPTLSQVKENVHGAGMYIAAYNAGTVGVDAEEVIDWCKQENLLVLEECSHSHGARYRSGLPGGMLGDVSVFSLYATKVVHAGEGAVIVTDNEALASTMRILRNYGKDGKAPVMIGQNWRMTEMQAALGRILFGHLVEIRLERMKIAQIYDQVFLSEDCEGKDHETLVKPLTGSGGASSSSYYKYIVVIPSMDTYFKNGLVVSKLHADEIHLQEKCNEQSLHTLDMIDNRIHLSPTYTEDPLSYFEADRYCMTHLCLPIYPTMIPETAEYVAMALINAVKEMEVRFGKK